MFHRPRITARGIARAALIAAMYAGLTLIWPPSFGPIQVRISEALTILPAFCPAAIPGLFAGCLISAMLAGSVWFDVVFGSLATLLAAHFTRVWRERPVIALMPPVILNALIVGPIVHFAYAGNPAPELLPITMLTVGAGELVACYGLGLPLRALLKRVPESLWQG